MFCYTSQKLVYIFEFDIKLFKMLIFIFFFFLILQVLLFSVEGRDCPNRWRLEGHHHDVVACDFSRDGALLATASCDTRVIVWDIHTRTMLLELG